MFIKIIDGYLIGIDLFVYLSTNIGSKDIFYEIVYLNILLDSRSVTNSFLMEII